MRKDQVLLEKQLQTAMNFIGPNVDSASKTTKRKTLKAHIEAALKLTSEARPLEQEPIRTIHHFSCTGGTLFAKCIASMANVLLLNEIDLHSSMPPVNRGKAAFTPTDMISLLRQGDKNLSPELVTKIFLSDLEVLRKEQWKIGRSIVLRDHSHSHFLTGEKITEQPSLLETIAPNLPTRSVITVRNPIDSWLSMERLGWNKTMTPSTFDEYCRRYVLFLQSHDTIPVFKYEDFTAEPKRIMKDICKLLDLRYYDEFDRVFSIFQFSGDSGRGGEKISKLPRRGEALNFDPTVSPNYSILAQKLAYV